MSESSPAVSGRGPVTPPAPGEPWTVLRLVRWSGSYLEEKGIDQGRLDAEHLLAASLDVSRLDLYLQFDRPLSPDELAAFKPRLLRRAEREPLQHVVGSTGFRELELTVDGRALIPRPETEVLVQTVLEWAADAGEGDRTALDVGTGTGAIALSLALEGPFERVVATDSSPEALALASENRGRAGLEATVELRRGLLYEPVAGERFHVVVSNPPYIALGDAGSLAPEVRDWEPGSALFAGEDGLAVLGPLIAGAPAVLRPGGLLALEVGLGQAGRVGALIREAEAFDEPRIERDLTGRDRIVTAVRR